MAEDVGDRVTRLRTELETGRDHYLWLGRWNYTAVYGLMILTVGSSAAAGILGLWLDPPTREVALLALIPAIAVSVGNQFKLQGKADWHYRKYDALKALLRRLNYDLPLKPSAAQVAEIGQALSKIEAEMTAAWEDSVAFKLEGTPTAANPSAKNRGRAAKGGTPKEVQVIE